MYPDLSATELARSVLVLLDLQVGLCTTSGPLGHTPLADQVEERQVRPRVAAVLQHWRGNGRRVVHVRVGIDPSSPHLTNRTSRFRNFLDRGAFRLGNPDTAFVPEATPAPGEPVLTKTCVDPFLGTPLTELLVGMQASTVLLGGIATNFVVESAARHASDIGLNVWVLSDLCASQSPEMHQFAVEKTLPTFARVTTSTDLGLRPT